MTNSEAQLKTTKRTWLPFLVLGGGILLTAAVSFFVSQNLSLRTQQGFRQEALQTEAHIKTRIEAYIALLRGGGALFAAGDWIGEPQFRAFVKRLRVSEFYGGVQGLGFALRITPENRELLKKIRIENPSFEIWPNEGQKEAFPIILLEPAANRNDTAIGYDMFSEPLRREAMVRARDTGLPAATGKVILVQEAAGSKEPGFLLYLPVYEDGKLPDTIEERRKTIKGYIYSPFRATDFLRSVAELQRNTGIQFEVYDSLEVAPKNLLFDSRSVLGGKDLGPDRLETVSHIEIAGEPWSIRCAAAPDLPSSAWIIPLLLVSGFSLTAVLSFLTYAEARARWRAEQTNFELNRSQSALKTSEELHRTVTQTASDGIIVADARGIIHSVNSAAEKILGYGSNELIGQALATIVPERLRERHLNGFSRFLKTGERTVPWSALQLPGRRKDGTEVPLEISYGSFSREKNTFITGIIRDISERKKAEEALQASQLQLQTIADALPVLIGAVDKDLRYRFNNRTYEKWLGKRKNEMSGKLMKEVLGAEAFADLEPHLNQGLSGHEASFETAVSYAGGIRHVHGTIIPEFDKQGNVEGLFLLMMDISDRKRQEIRAEVLVRAGKALSESLDFKETLRKVAHLAVPGIADWCSVDLLNDNGELQRLEVAHTDPAKKFFARDWDQRFGPLPDSETVRKVVKEGLVLFEPEVTDTFLQKVARSEDHLKELRVLGIQSVISVPIRGRRGIYGIIILVTSESRRVYNSDDVHAAEELASHVGLAVENALFLQEAQQEIQERRIVEQAFRESEERFRIMVEQARDYAIFMLDPGGFISSWNSGAERILGYSESEILGQRASIIFTPEDREAKADEAELEVAKEKGKALDERWHVRKDGTRFFCSGYLFALRNENGDLRGFTKIMRDITERKRWEEDIQRLNQELETRVEQRTAALRESYEQMETFTYTVAHDLRAPLRSMLGFSQAIMEENEGRLDDTSLDYLHRIMRASARMDSLIQDLLAYSHLARTDLKFEPVSLQDVINDALNMLVDEVQERNAVIVSHGPFPRVFAHRATLHTIVFNLISNAIKFSHLSGAPRVELKAEIILRDNQRWVRCWVIDNGIGISDEHLERIFRVFERLHGPDKYSGTGIGLAIVKKGVERMNGAVGVESKQNEGSRFWIELPAAD